MSVTEKITEKLQAELEPSILTVINESHLHTGHAGDDGSGESHFRVEIASAHFDGLSRVAKERLVHQVLSEEIPLIHAISIKIL